MGTFYHCGPHSYGGNLPCPRCAAQVMGYRVPVYGGGDDLKIAQLTITIDHLKARIAALERGEFICEKCGLRKDGEVTEDPGF